MIEYENLRKVNEPFFDELKKSFETTLERGWYILGSNVETFERQFASYCGADHCVGVASGLDAILLSLKNFDFGSKKEVIVPSNTYIATILAVLHAGLTPVLVEPDIRSYNIDPGKIEASITKNTVAVIVVHLYGKVCDMDPVLEIVRRHGLVLIEDCAQAHGAAYRGKKAGMFGHCAAFSFYPTKNLGALGDGGAVLTNDAGIAERLKKLDDINRHKRNLAALYLEHLKDDFIKPTVNDNYFDVYHIFNIRHPERDKIQEYLLKKNIKTDIHYPVPPHKQKAMKGILDPCVCRISEEIHSTTLSLPISYSHTEDDIGKVIETLNSF